MDPNFIKENKVKIIVLGVLLLGCIYFFFLFGKGSDPKPVVTPPTAEEIKVRDDQQKANEAAAKKSPPRGS